MRQQASSPFTGRGIVTWSTQATPGRLDWNLRASQRRTHSNAERVSTPFAT